jgi:hypothetical protein
MIKRRKDYEVYCRCRAVWHQAWQVFGKVYSVYLVFHPEFLKFCWQWEGRRLRTFLAYLTFDVLGEARPESEIWAEEEECREEIAKCGKMLAEQL